MLDSQLFCKVSLVAGVLGCLTVAACSNQSSPVASHGSVAGAASRAAAVSPAAGPADAAQPNAAQPSAPQPLHLVTLPKGTEITATVDQTLASGRNHWGDTFAASLVRPIRVDGKTVLPPGTEVTGRVSEVKHDELKVVLAAVVVDGVYCDLVTNARRPSDKDQPKHTGKKNNRHKQKKDNSVLSARTRLTFKLSKPATIPAKA